MATTGKNNKYVYFFGGGKADGNESMKDLLGGKGANLAEMAGHPKLKLPVPPGFTVTTEVCTYLTAHKKTYPKTLKAEVSIDAPDGKADRQEVRQRIEPAAGVDPFGSEAFNAWNDGDCLERRTERKDH